MKFLKPSWGLYCEQIKGWILGYFSLLIKIHWEQICSNKVEQVDVCPLLNKKVKKYWLKKATNYLDKDSKYQVRLNITLASLSLYWPALLKLNWILFQKQRIMQHFPSTDSVVKKNLVVAAELAAVSCH